MNTLPRILLVADLSECTREVLDDVVHMHHRWGTRVDAYYLWTNAAEVSSESPERMLRELEAFSRNEGAWEALDALGALDRTGVVAIRGYLTASPSEPTLAEHAATYGYLGILYGTATPPPSSQGFAIHGNLPIPEPGGAIRSTVSIVSAPLAGRDRIRSHAR